MMLSNIFNPATYAAFTFGRQQEHSATQISSWIHLYLYILG